MGTTHPQNRRSELQRTRTNLGATPGLLTTARPTAVHPSGVPRRRRTLRPADRICVDSLHRSCHRRQCGSRSGNSREGGPSGVPERLALGRPRPSSADAIRRSRPVAVLGRPDRRALGHGHPADRCETTALPDGFLCGACQLRPITGQFILGRSDSQGQLIEGGQHSQGHRFVSVIVSRPIR